MCIIAQGLEESEGRITALISKVRTLENVNTDLNKKITGLDRRGKEQEALHKKQVGKSYIKNYFSGIGTKIFAKISLRIFTEKIACKITPLLVFLSDLKLGNLLKDFCKYSTYPFLTLIHLLFRVY
jgi:hypothetical protein